MLFFESITDGDNQGKVTGASISGRDNQANFVLIITKVTTSPPTFPILPMITGPYHLRSVRV
jgi:hypothetical protein